MAGDPFFFRPCFILGETMTGSAARMRNVVRRSICITLGTTMMSATAWSASFSSLGARYVPTNISADGSTIVGYLNDRGGPPYQAVYWDSARDVHGLGFLPGGGSSSTASAVSADGKVIVGTNSFGQGSQAFVWDATNGMRGLGETFQSARGVSADGSIAVGWGLPGTGDQAVIWRAGTGLLSLGDYPGGAVLTSAVDISADGTTVVGTATTDRLSGDAFVWNSEAGMRPMFPDSAYSTYASAISADGSTVVGQAGNIAFIWSPSLGASFLGTLPGRLTFSSASDVSGDGSIVVVSSWASGVGLRAFVWDESNGMRSLEVLLKSQGIDLTGWILEQASAVSIDGQTVIGTGRNPLGQPAAWIAVIPEPTTALLMLLGLAGLSYRR